MYSSVKAKKENWIIRLIITLVWLAASYGVWIWASTNGSYLIASAIEFAFAAITFTVPYLSKKGRVTRWIGWGAVLAGMWFLYCKFF